NSTGSTWATSYGTSGSGTTLALTASPVFTGSPTVPGYVPTSTTVNGHALSSNVTVSASDLTTGTLPHAQLPALLSGDIPTNAANTSGTAGTGTLVSGNYVKATGAGGTGVLADAGVTAGPYASFWALPGSVST